MAIPKEHFELSINIPQEQGGEISEVHAFVREYYGGKEYFSFTRETFGGRSIKHLHIHFIRGNATGEGIIRMLQED